jgi:hypothetical protein
MTLKKNGFGNSGSRISLTLAGLVLLTASIASWARAQTTEGPKDEPPVSIEDLYMLPGVQVAAGADKQASGPLQIQSYKLEEVTLPRPLKLGQGNVVNSVLRLTVTLGVDLHQDFTIFVDDEPKQAAVTQRHAISSLFFSPNELEDGAKISVAIGGGCNARRLSTMKSTLQLPEGRKLPQRGNADPGFGVKKLRSVAAPKGARDRRNEVEFHLTTPVPFEISNELLVMQVGGLEVLGGGYGSDPNTLIFTMSAEEFSRAEDGKQIKVKYGPCSAGGTRFGKLNKAQLDQ